MNGYQAAAKQKKVKSAVLSEDVWEKTIEMQPLKPFEADYMSISFLQNLR